MKKVFLGLIFAGCISLCACGGNDVTSEQPVVTNNSDVSVETEAVETTEASEDKVSANTEEANEEQSEAVEEATTEESEDAVSVESMFPGISVINVTSPNLSDGVWDTKITKTEKGENASPQLDWDEVEGATSYAVFMVDETATNWMHMDVYTTDNFITEGELSDSPRGHQYVGPYPPSGTHTYTVYVYALKNDVDKVKFMFNSAAINNSPEMLFEGHDTDIDGNTGNVLAVGRLEGTYTYGD